MSIYLHIFLNISLTTCILSDKEKESKYMNQVQIFNEHIPVHSQNDIHGLSSFIHWMKCFSSVMERLWNNPIYFEMVWKLAHDDWIMFHECDVRMNAVVVRGWWCAEVVVYCFTKQKQILIIVERCKWYPAFSLFLCRNIHPWMCKVCRYP